MSFGGGVPFSQRRDVGTIIRRNRRGERRKPFLPRQSFIVLLRWYPRRTARRFVSPACERCIPSRFLRFPHRHRGMRRWPCGHGSSGGGPPCITILVIFRISPVNIYIYMYMLIYLQFMTVKRFEIQFVAALPSNPWQTLQSSQ